MKALVIDDNEACRRSVAMRLRKGLSHECDESCHLEEALGLFNANIYDYVILDMRIPSDFGGLAMVANGRAMLSNIRKRFSPAELPVIVLSGEISLPQDAADLISVHGANDFILKASEGSGRVLEDTVLKWLERKAVCPEVSDASTSTWLKVHKGTGELVWTSVSKSGEEKVFPVKEGTVLCQVLECVRVHNDGPCGVEHQHLMDEVVWHGGRYRAKRDTEGRPERRGRIRVYVSEIKKRLGVGHEFTEIGIRFTRPE